MNRSYACALALMVAVILVIWHAPAGNTQTIAPAPIYATLLGGEFSDWAFDIAADDEGAAYIFGSTGAGGFPTTPGAFLPNASAGDGVTAQHAYITKLDPHGSLAYSTYLGRFFASSIAVGAVAVDAHGSAYIAGTASAVGPVTDGAFQSSLPPGLSAFVAKLDPSGSHLEYFTYLGGFGSNLSYAIAVDDTGSAYVAGVTDASNFPTTAGAFRETHSAANDGFLSKLNPEGSALVYSTFLGGTRGDLIADLALDAQGCVYVMGYTDSPDFPVTEGAFQPQLANGTDGPFIDLFVSKFNPSGTGLVYSTYLGGSGTELTNIGGAGGIAVDSEGRASIVGSTASLDFPITQNAFQNRLAGTTDAVVAVLTPSGSELAYSTYLGGRDVDYGQSLALDRAENIYVRGGTLSGDFPVSADALQQTPGGNRDIFLTVLGRSGSRILYSTRLGGPSLDVGYGLQVDPDGRVYFAGTVFTPGIFPTSENAFQTEPAGGIEALAVKLGPPPASITAPTVVNGASFQSGPIAPGEIISVFANNFGPAELTTLRLEDSGRVATQLAETRLLFDGRAAPLLHVLKNQLAAIVPYGVAGQASTQVQVEYQGVRSAVSVVGVAATSPAIFVQGSTQHGAILNQDGSVNTVDNPAGAGTVISIFATGEGQTDPEGVDGLIAGDELPRPLAPVSAAIGDRRAEIIYAGAAPSLVSGVLQVNARIPLQAMPANEAPVVLTVGMVDSPAVTVAVAPPVAPE